MPVQLSVVDDSPMIEYVARAPVQLVLGDPTSIRSDDETIEGSGRVTDPIKVKTLKDENFPDDIIKSRMVADDQIENSHMAPNAVATEQVQRQAIDYDKLAAALQRRILPAPGVNANRGRIPQVGPNDLLRYIENFDSVVVGQGLRGDGTAGNPLLIGPEDIISAMLRDGLITNAKLGTSSVNDRVLGSNSVGRTQAKSEITDNLLPSGASPNEVLLVTPQGAVVFDRLSGAIITDDSIIEAKLASALRARLTPAVESGDGPGYTLQVNNAREADWVPPFIFKSENVPTGRDAVEGNLWFRTSDRNLYLRHEHNYVQLAYAPEEAYTLSKSRSGSDVVLSWVARTAAEGWDWRSRAAADQPWSAWNAISGSGPTTESHTVIGGNFDHDYEVAYRDFSGRRHISGLAKVPVWRAVTRSRELLDFDPSRPGSATALAGLLPAGWGTPRDIAYGSGIWVMLSTAGQLYRFDPVDPTNTAAPFGSLGALSAQAITSDGADFYAFTQTGTNRLSRVDWRDPESNVGRFGPLDTSRWMVSGIRPNRVLGLAYVNNGILMAATSLSGQRSALVNPLDPTDVSGAFGIISRSAPTAMGRDRSAYAGLTYGDGLLLGNSLNSSPNDGLWRLNPDEINSTTSPYGRVGAWPRDVNDVTGLAFGIT